MRPALRKLVSQPETLSSEVAQNNKTALEFFESGSFNEKNPKYEKIKEMKLVDYDIGPKTPQPLKSKSSNSSFWEYYILSQSYHPHISNWATNTLQKQKQKYQGNPLHDFQMKGFLDRFCFKKPKKQKLDSKKKRSYVSYAKRELPANVVIPSVQDEKVREEEKFFKTYFDLKKQTNTDKKVKRKKVKGDALENLDIEYDSNAVVDAGLDKMDFWKSDENDANAGSFLDDDGKIDYGDEDEDEVEDVDVFDDNEGEWRGYEEMNNLDPDDLDDLAGSSEEEDGVFADADEFAEMLEDSDSEEKTKTKKRKRPNEKKSTKPRKKQRF